MHRLIFWAILIYKEYLTKNYHIKKIQIGFGKLYTDMNNVVMCYVLHLVE